MATEEIEISELEFTEELTSDNLIPIESSTETRATSLQILKNWLSSFFASLTQSQTFSGYNIFTGGLESKKTGVGLSIKNPNLTFGEVPSVDCYNSISFADKRGNVTGILDCANGINDTGYVRCLFRYNKEGVAKQAGINISKTERGETYLGISTDLTQTPTPIMGDNSAKIANTNWVHNAGAVVTAKSFGANGYVKYSSGLIIQWGSVDLGINNITFPTAFSNENAIVCPVAYYNSASQIAYYDLTTTGCKIYPNRSDYSVRWFAIGY